MEHITKTINLNQLYARRLNLLALPQRQPQSKLRQLTLTGLIASSLVFSTTSYAALSASTANTIQGTLPALSFDGTTPETNLDGLLRFTMPDPAGGATPIAIDPTTYPTATPVSAKKRRYL